MRRLRMLLLHVLLHKVTRRIHTWHDVGYDSFLCDMACSCVWHEEAEDAALKICAVAQGDTTHACVTWRVTRLMSKWDDLFTCVTWGSAEAAENMFRCKRWNGAFMCDVTCDVTNTYVKRLVRVCDMIKLHMLLLHMPLHKVTRRIETWLEVLQSIPLGVTCSKAVSKIKARTSLSPRFSDKRRSSFEVWALKELSKMSPQMGLAVLDSFICNTTRSRVWHEEAAHAAATCAVAQSDTIHSYVIYRVIWLMYI